MSRSFSSGPVLWACLIFTAPLCAQDAPPPAPLIAPEIASEPVVALDELIQRALQNNPQFSVARETLNAALERREATRALDNPVLQIVPGIGNRQARDEEIILSQPLDLFGKRRARRDVATAQLHSAETSSSLAERTLIVAVKNTAAELFAAQEAEALGEVQVEVARLFRAAAARRAELGDVPPVQVQRADLEWLRAQNALSGAQAERLSRRAALNQLVGQTPQTPLRVAFAEGGSSTLIPIPLTPNESGEGEKGSGQILTPEIGASSQVGSDLVGLREQLLPGALQRPDIVNAQAALEARRAQVQVLARERRPDIEIQARRSSVFGSSSTALRAVVVVPLFDYGSNKRERRALEAEARAQEAQIVLLQAQAAMQIEQALIRLQQQHQTVARYRSGIVPQTLDLLRKTQIGYEAGASTYLEVLEAQRTLRQVQTEYLQALVGTRTGEAALESALGATLPAALGEISNPNAAVTPPDVATPGTVPDSLVPPNVVEPLAQGGR